MVKRQPNYKAQVLFALLTAAIITFATHKFSTGQLVVPGKGTVGAAGGSKPKVA